MPVHFKVAAHNANPLGEVSYIATAEDLLSKPGIIPQSRNGFVDTVVAAYNNHHHLVIRPDDVWMAILGQFNIYVNGHAEELRSHFVQHEGQKHLVIKEYGNRYSVNFGVLAERMTGLIDENLNDRTLKTWILPDFSTTTHNDTVICAVLMMATFKAYFSFGITLACGIPSVTLEGEKSDWEKLLARIERLKEFGVEPEAWARLLRPILTRFVQAFDGEPDIDFWGKVCDRWSQGSGGTFLRGWITAFCVWNAEGRWQGPRLTGSGMSTNCRKEPKVLILDDVAYGSVELGGIPTGICEVDVKLDDNGEEFECMMVSGQCATLIEGEMKDTVRPLPSWFMFIKESCEDPEVVEMAAIMKHINCWNY